MLKLDKLSTHLPLVAHDVTPMGYATRCYDLGHKVGYDEGWERGFDAGLEDSEDNMPNNGMSGQSCGQ